MDVNFYKEAIYKEAMEKEAVWGAVAGLAAKALPYLAKAAPVAKQVLTKDLAKSMASGAVLGGGIGALTSPEDRVGGALKGALSFGGMSGASHIGLKNVVPALAKTQMGKSVAESSVGKYISSKPRRVNMAKGAIGDAAAFGVLGALPTKENKETYGEGIGGSLKGATSGALGGAVFGGIGGAFTKIPKKEIPTVSYGRDGY